MKFKFFLTGKLILALSAGINTALAETPYLAESAGKLAAQVMIVDTHIDVPYRIEEEWEDVTGASEKGDFDYARASAGGLNIPFMSIYTPAESEADGTSFQLANKLIDSVEALVGRAPGRFMMVKSPADAETAMKQRKIGLALGMENGSPIDGKLENLSYFQDRGISYRGFSGNRVRSWAMDWLTWFGFLIPGLWFSGEDWPNRRAFGMITWTGSRKVSRNGPGPCM